LFLSITAFGTVPRGTMVRRDRARASDRLYVSGTIGDAAAGLALHQGSPEWAAGLDADARGFLVDRYLHPQPRLALAPILRAHASAAMDISDGLVGDLTKMLRVSGLSAKVELLRISFSDAARAALAADPSLRDLLLAGGDDYEILCTIPADRCQSFELEAQAARVIITSIGEVTEAAGAPNFIDQEGRTVSFAHGSFSHF
jgi:thiamine-monophosphate kinase